MTLDTNDYRTDLNEPARVEKGTERDKTNPQSGAEGEDR